MLVLMEGSRTHEMSAAIMNATGCFLRSVHPHWDNCIMWGIDLYMAGWMTQCEVPGDASRSGQKLDAAYLSIMQSSLKNCDRLYDDMARGFDYTGHLGDVGSQRR